ncbi:hypothetical protein XA68_11628 [Ophiocordyceps unilateralis]|uniref:WW domain-containing protein n=1 Tax=Ophiocordyceps unilateralis TaxID=268505 RepID=A0A2A9PPS1_OPHUN|nr:hypothetical protein XA68_11628 [Ophiocordyceps unilateralis]
MSFLKNFTKDLDRFGLGDKKQDQPPQNQQSSSGYGYHGGYGNDRPPSPAAQYHAAPPQPAYQPPSDKPPLPAGWRPLFDQENQRWYYLEEDSGRTQWEAPGYNAPSPPMGGFAPPVGPPPGHAHASYGPPDGPPPSYGQGQHGAPDGPPPGRFEADYGGHAPQEKQSGGKGGMLLGAAGGLAAGAAGGALLHRMNSDRHDQDENYASYGQQIPPSESYGHATATEEESGRHDENQESSSSSSSSSDDRGRRDERDESSSSSSDDDRREDRYDDDRYDSGSDDDY